MNGGEKSIADLKSRVTTKLRTLSASPYESEVDNNKSYSNHVRSAVPSGGVMHFGNGITYQQTREANLNLLVQPSQDTKKNNLGGSADADADADAGTTHAAVNDERNDKKSTSSKSDPSEILAAVLLGGIVAYLMLSQFEKNKKNTY